MTVFIIMYMQIHCISDTFGGGGGGAIGEKKNHHLFLGEKRNQKLKSKVLNINHILVEWAFSEMCREVRSIRGLQVYE